MDLQKMLYLNDELFKVRWEMNSNTKDYDLLVTIPKIESEDARIKDTRSRIREYLRCRELEYIKENNIVVEDFDSWAPGFNPDKYPIPTKLLPSHP